MMEPLKHPKQLLCPFKVNPNSALQSLLGKSSSNSQGSQRTSQASSEASSQRDNPQSIEELDGRLRAALALFGDVAHSATFARELGIILEVSSSLGPNQRAYAKSLESALNEFLEAEEKGGFPKDVILEVVREIQHAYECSFEISVDRKLLQELLGVVEERENVAGGQNGRQTVRPTALRHARVMEDSDQDMEDEEQAEEEVADVVWQLTEPEEENEEEGLRQRWSEENFVETKRVQIAATLQPERQLIIRSMEKLFEKVRNKRGYNWSVVEGQIVDAPSDDSIQVGPLTQDKIIQDPVFRKDIRHLAVKSKNCAGPHLYEHDSLVAMLRDLVRKEHRGMKCAYMGCGTFILPADLIEDEEYNRFLARTAQEQQAEL